MHRLSVTRHGPSLTRHRLSVTSHGLSAHTYMFMFACFGTPTSVLLPVHAALQHIDAYMV